MAVLRVWFTVRAKLDQSNYSLVVSGGNAIAQKIAVEIESFVMAADAFHRRLETSKVENDLDFNFEADLILHQNKELLFFGFIDNEINFSGDLVTGVNEEWIYELYEKVFINSSINSNTKESIITYRSEEKGNLIIFNTPFYKDQQYEGSIIFAVDIKSFLESELNNLPQFYLEVSDTNQHLLYSSYTPFEIRDQYIYSKSITFESSSTQELRLKVTTTALFFENNNFKFIYIGLIVALTLSLLLSVTVFTVQKLKQSSKNLGILNQQLFQEREKADNASLAKTEFLSNMSHEIRTPLSAILGFLSIMKMEKLTLDQKSYVNLMETSSKNLLSIVNDILEVEKIESGEISLSSEVFYPIDEIKKMVQIQQPFFEEKGLYMNINISNESINVIGDPDKFQQICTNLIRNAFKFTEKGGLEIWVQNSIDKEQIKLIVLFKDTGIGISKEKVDVIFDRFTQVDSSSKRKYEGTGLGLAITKKLAEAMGGSIQVKSEVGFGTEFEVTLVFKSVKDQKENLILIEDEFDESELPSYASKKILVVDDHFVNILVIKKVLSKYGINSDHTENGEEAVQKVLNNHYDMVFMDIHMPLIDGFETTRQIRALGFTMPIIGLSADVTKQTILDAKESGMQDYLTKPFTRAELEKNLSLFLVNQEKN